MEYIKLLPTSAYHYVLSVFFARRGDIDRDRVLYSLFHCFNGIFSAFSQAAYNQVRLHQANIKALREKPKCFGEIKWTKVSKSQAEFYLEVVEYFFSSDLQFRAIVVEKEKVSTDNFDGFYYTGSRFFYSGNYCTFFNHPHTTKRFYQIKNVS